MADEKHESSGFKVVDRRPFQADGSLRQDVPPPEPKPEPPKAGNAQPGPRPVERRPEPGPLIDSGEPSGFETLVSYLSTTAMFQLGLLAGPSGERIPPDTPSARRTIDMLEVLQGKTAGNLTLGEQQLLEDVLYDLRMTCVEMERRGAPPRK